MNESKKKDRYEDAKKFVRYSDGAKMYSMGMTKFQEVAKDAKACYKIGQLVLVNTEILDKYLETLVLGKGNKLELDEDELKKADISSLKTVFTGYNSFAGKTAQKAAGISNAANRASATYTNNGTYSKTNSSLTSSKIDKEV